MSFTVKTLDFDPHESEITSNTEVLALLIHGTQAYTFTLLHMYANFVVLYKILNSEAKSQVCVRHEWDHVFALLTT